MLWQTKQQTEETWIQEEKLKERRLQGRDIEETKSESSDKDND